MLNRILEVTRDGVHLSLSRGFVVLSKDKAEIGRVGLPDIAALIVRGHGSTLSLNLAARLAEENISVILCGSNQSPAAIIWPVEGHHGQGHIIDAQAALSRPAQKQLWQVLICGKIEAQADVLENFGEDANDLRQMARRVKSGDSDNLEAQAARKYWSRLMQPVDDTFKRDTGGTRYNGWLNYGYAVLRAGAARSILAAGLHPSLSIHHESRGEALRLASDIMEPFRPYVDMTVRCLAQDKSDDLELTPDLKAEIVRVLSIDLVGPQGASPLQTCLDRLCQSFAARCLKERMGLELPGGLAVSPARGG